MTRTPRSNALSPSLRAFLVCFLVIAVTAGGAAAVVLLLHGEAGGDRAAEALDSSYAAFTTLERERYDRLGLLARRMAAEPSVRALTATEEPSGEQREEVLATLQQALPDLGFLLLLDADGRVLARADSSAANTDLAPVLATNVGDGIRIRGGSLYHTSAAAIAAEPTLPGVLTLGYVVAGREVDHVLLSRLKRIGRCDLLLLAPGPGGFLPAGGTLDRSGDAVVAALSRPAATSGSALDRVLAEGRAIDRLAFPLGERRYRALVAPLFDAPTPGGERKPAAVLALVTEEAPADTNRMRRLAGILASAAVALLLSIPLSMLFGGSVTGPLRALTQAVAKARRGELDSRQGLTTRRSGAIGALAGEVEALLADLGQERSLREAVGKAAATTPARDGERPTATSAAVRQTALLGVELRRFAREREPAAVGRLATELERLGEAVSREGGRVEAVLGHRVLASFEGAGGPRRALAAAGEIFAALPAGDFAGDETERPAVALAVGSAVTGWLPAADSSAASEGRRLTVGLTVQLLETLMREATGGEILLSRDAEKELRDALHGAGVEAVAQRGMLTPQSLFSVAPRDARRATAGSGDVLDLASPEAFGLDAPAAPSTPLGRGDILGDRFEIRGEVGAGPLGKVFRAHDRELGREVALKLLRPEALVSAAPLEDLDGTLAPLRTFTDPHVARVYDFGVVAGVPFVSRQWVAGVSLRELLERVGPLTPAAALGAGRQLAAGVAAAHRERILHLRLKPENVLFQADGGLRVADFGLASLASPSLEGDEASRTYRAPELESSPAQDPRADVFACGLLLHRLFTAGGSPATTEPGRGTVPEAVEGILRRCLETDPGHRYAHAGELLAALEGVGLV